MQTTVADFRANRLFPTLILPLVDTAVGPVFRASGQSSPYGIPVDVVNHRSKMPIIPNIPVPTLPRPDRRMSSLGSPSASSAFSVSVFRDAKTTLCEPGQPRPNPAAGIALPRLHNTLQRHPPVYANQHMDVIRHDDPCDKIIAFPREVPPVLNDAGGRTRILQYARPMSRIQPGIEILAPLGFPPVWANQAQLVPNPRQCFCWKTVRKVIRDRLQSLGEVGVGQVPSAIPSQPHGLCAGVTLGSPSARLAPFPPFFSHAELALGAPRAQIFTSFGHNLIFSQPHQRMQPLFSHLPHPRPCRVMGHGPSGQ